jgi:N-methylhydantoinase A/oxoprolinase/acetone carboxylase beta subunit
VPITLSHHLAGLGLLVREAAAALNAALRHMAGRLMPQLRSALRAAGLPSAALHISSNDGTLMSAEAAEALPIATLLSGPVNLLRGAAALTGGRWEGPLTQPAPVLTAAAVLVLPAACCGCDSGAAAHVLRQG